MSPRTYPEGCSEAVFCQERWGLRERRVWHFQGGVRWVQTPQGCREAGPGGVRHALWEVAPERWWPTSALGLGNVLWRRSCLFSSFFSYFEPTAPPCPAGLCGSWLLVETVGFPLPPGSPWIWKAAMTFGKIQDRPADESDRQARGRFCHPRGGHPLQMEGGQEAGRLGSPALSPIWGDVSPMPQHREVTGSHGWKECKDP